MGGEETPGMGGAPDLGEISAVKVEASLETSTDVLNSSAGGD